MKIDLTPTHDVDGAYQLINWSNIKSKYKDPGTRYCFDVLDKKYLQAMILSQLVFVICEINKDRTQKIFLIIIQLKKLKKF